MVVQVEIVGVAGTNLQVDKNGLVESQIVHAQSQRGCLIIRISTGGKGRHIRTIGHAVAIVIGIIDVGGAVAVGIGAYAIGVETIRHHAGADATFQPIRQTILIAVSLAWIEVPILSVISEAADFFLVGDAIGVAIGHSGIGA